MICTERIGFFVCSPGLVSTGGDRACDWGGVGRHLEAEEKRENEVETERE